jgi:peptidoglycan/xylan/chitin deacetylase (PgdA/CDA1 family)
MLRPSARKAGAVHDRVVVLLYHSVHPSPGPASTTPEEFRAHLSWLTEHCRLISLERTLEAVPASDDPRPSVAITFDDGFANNHEYALPSLVDHGVPATFFLTTGLINGDARVALRFSRMLGVNPEDVKGLSWGQVLELQAEGLAIGAHTVTHPNLAQLDPATASREIEVCKHELEDRLGVEVSAFAYPFGKPKHHFSWTTIDQVQEGGYSLAVTVNHRGVKQDEPRFSIPRFAVAHDNVDFLKAKVQGERDGLGVWQQTAPRWLSNLASPDHSFSGELSLLDTPDSDEVSWC